MALNELLLIAFIAISVAGAVSLLPWRRKPRRNAEVIGNLRLWRVGR